MSSSSEAELGAMLITAQEMVVMRQTLQEMKCTQPKSPLQTDNSAAAGVVNNTIVPRKLKTMDRRVHWIRCREAQGQFHYYWASGNLNWGDFGCGHFISCYVCLIATISCDVMNIAPNSASEAEDMKNLMIFASVSTVPFQRGIASFSERKICAP